MHFSPPLKSSIWAGCPLQWNHFEKSLHFAPLWKIFVFFTTLKNLRVFHLSRSPITTRSLWKNFTFFTTLKNLCIFHNFEKSSCFSPGQVPHYNKITLKKFYIFYNVEKSLHFSQLWKIFVFFTWAGPPLQQDHFEKSSYFSSLWKISVFFIYLKNLHVFHLGRSPSTTRPLWKIFVFFTVSKKSPKNLCVFHPGRSPITIRPPQKTFFNFLWVGHPWQFDHSKISEFAKENLPDFTLSALSSPQNDSSFLNMMSPSSFILLFLYNAYYLKSLTRLSIVNIVKRGATVITKFWVIPQKFTFFQNKNQKQ